MNGFDWYEFAIRFGIITVTFVAFMAVVIAFTFGRCLVEEGGHPILGGRRKPWKKVVGYAIMVVMAMALFGMLALWATVAPHT